MTGLFSSLKSKVFGQKEYSFVAAKSFKGFKKFYMEVNLDPEAKENNLKFKDIKTDGMPLVFKDIAQDRIDVYLNNIKIGFICDGNRLADLRENKVTDFAVKFEEDHVFDADSSETRFRAHLLAKYK